MDQYAYLRTMISILVGFAIAEILSSLGQVIRLRDRVKVWWPAVIWLLLVVILLVQMWWSYWQYRAVLKWSILDFGILLAQPLTLILAIFIMAPRITEKGEATFDLKEHYWRNHRWFFLLGAATLALFAVLDVVVLNRSWPTPYDTVRMPGLILLLVLAFSKSEKLHLVLLAVLSVLLLLFFAVSGQLFI